jgi:hypothetical protein
MKIKGWIMDVSCVFLCSSSWGAMDELVSSESNERPELKESLTLDEEPKPEESFRPEEQEDGVARLIQALKDYSEKAKKEEKDYDPAVQPTVEILLDHVGKPDLAPMLQTLFEKGSCLTIEKFGERYPEMVINVVKGCLDFKGQIQELQTLEEHLVNDNLTLPFLALSEEDRNFVRECTPEGCESETYNFLADKLSEYFAGQQPESDAPNPDTIPEKLDGSNEEEENEEEKSLDNFQREDYDFSLRENDPVWLKQIKKPITQQLDSNHTPEELHQRSIDFKKSLESKEDVPWDELFKLSVAKQFKLHHTPEELHRMNIIREKIIKIELALALCQRELTPKEKPQLFKAIYALDRSPEQGLLDAIFDVSCIPQTSFQRVKSIAEERNVDVNSKYKEFSFLVMASGVYKNQGLEIVQFLLDHEADIEIADGRGWTALHNAVWEKNIKVVKLLIERKANVNAQVKSPRGENWAEGWTSLHFALNHGYFKIAKVLLANGADPNMRNDDDKTPFDLAMEESGQIEDETKKKKFDEAFNGLHL